MNNKTNKLVYWIRYIFHLNDPILGLAFPSVCWSIRKWCRYKDFFGYWTEFRKKEEGLLIERNRIARNRHAQVK